MLNFGNQNTLPEQVAINKANIEALAAEVEKLGYTPKGEYSASAEYVYNDVVFYNYKLYAMIVKDATIEGVAPTDTTKWQAITGDIKGQQGQQGPAGDDGQAGADGKDALVYNSYMTALQTPIVNTNANIDNDQFNRDPVVGDVFEAFFVNSTTGHTYFIIYQAVAIVSSTVTQFKVKYVIDITGAQGASGKIALVYDQTISFTYSASQQLITADLPFANFNRTPELNEDFIAILKDSGVEYLANCEVQTISGTNVTSIVASNITKVSGADGTNGTDGTNGVDALAYTEIYRYAGALSVSDSVSMTLTKFTRTPIANEKIVFVYEDTVNNLTYQVQANIDSVGETTAAVTIEYLYQLTGAQGQAGTGTTLNKYTATNITLAKINSIVGNAKGSIDGNIDFNIGASRINFNAKGLYKIEGTNLHFSGDTIANISGVNYYCFIDANLAYGSLQTASGILINLSDGTVSTPSSITYASTYTTIVYYNDSQLH